MTLEDRSQRARNAVGCNDTQEDVARDAEPPLDEYSQI